MSTTGILAMGGYGFYVWGSFGAFVLFLLWDALAPAWRRRRLLRQLALRMRRDRARKQAAAGTAALDEALR